MGLGKSAKPVFYPFLTILVLNFLGAIPQRWEVPHPPLHFASYPTWTALRPLWVPLRKLRGVAFGRCSMRCKEAAQGLWRFAWDYAHVGTPWWRSTGLKRLSPAFAVSIEPIFNTPNAANCRNNVPKMAGIRSPKFARKRIWRRGREGTRKGRKEKDLGPWLRPDWS